MTPPAFADENDDDAASGVYAIGWSLLLIVTPLLLLLAWAVPALSTVPIEIAVGLCVISAGSLYLVHGERLFAASLWQATTCWALFSWVIWFTGGLQSAGIASLFVIVILVGAMRGWRWGATAATAGVLTVGVLGWAGSTGMLPTSRISTSVWSGAATYAAYFVALGALQGVTAINVQRTRKRASNALSERRAAEKRLLDVVDNAPFAAIVSAATPGRSLRVAHVNPAASEVLGVDATQFVGSSLGEALWALSGQDDILKRFEHIALHGGTHHAETVPYYIAGRRGMLELHGFQIAKGSMAVFFSDVTERRKAQFEMHRMAFHDELTTLPNRKLLMDRLEMALAGARRRGTTVALLFIDLDNFKPINDRFGHPFGDDLLVAVAARLRDNARRTDTVARFGGDEFTLLMPDVTERDQVRIVADKLIAAFAEPFQVNDRSVHVTASIGIGITDDMIFTPEALLERADNGMYHAKRAGRNGYRIS